MLVYHSQYRFGPQSRRRTTDTGTGPRRTPVSATHPQDALPTVTPDDDVVETSLVGALDDGPGGPAFRNRQPARIHASLTYREAD